jgi:hypothetical protein
MAKTTFEIDIETAGAVNSAKDLREQFNILEDKMFELAAAGREGTKEFAAIRNQLAGTKERIDDLNESIDMLKPEAKFQAFANLGAGIANGFAAAQGAAQLFGSESEALNESLAKVQSAMALAQGIQGLAGMGDSLKVVSTMLKSTTIGTYLATAAQRVYNAVMAANPIGLLVAGLTALVGVIALVVNAMGDETEALKETISEREKELELMNRSADALKNENKFRLDLAAAQGKNAKELQKINEENAKSEIKSIDLRIKENKRLFDERMALMRQSDGDEYKELQEANSKTLEEMRKLAGERLSIQQGLKLSEAKLETDANKESVDKRKEANEKYIQDFKELQKKLEDLKAQNILDAEDRELKTLELAYNREKAELKSKGANNELLLQLDLKYFNDRADIENKYIDIEEKRKKDEKDAREKEFADAVAYAEKLADEEFKLDEEKRKKQKEADEKAKVARQAEINSNFKMTSDAIGALIELNNSYPATSEKNARKSFKINKALQLAQATINGVQAVQNVLADPTLVGPARYVAAAIAGVTALANINKIAQTKFEPSSESAGGGGGGGNLGSFSQGGGGQPPQGLTAQNTVTQLNPDGSVAGQGERNAAPMKAYVVESESRAVTDRVNKLSNNSKIG